MEEIAGCMDGLRRNEGLAAEYFPLVQSMKDSLKEMDNTFARDAEEAKSSKSMGKSLGQGASDSQSAVASRKRFREQQAHLAALDEAEALQEDARLKERVEKQERVLSLSKSKERPKTGQSKAGEQPTESVQLKNLRPQTGVPPRP